MTWASGGSATVQRVAAKKHYYRTGTISCSAVAKYALNSTGTIFWYFSPNGDVVNTGNREIAAGTTISQTITSNASQVTPYIFATSYSSPSCSSVSAVYNYGSKATPTVYGSPSSGFVNPDSDHVFSFGANTISGIDEQYTVSSGTFYYKESTASTYTSIAMTGRNFILPANTFEIGKTYNYYATLTLDDGTTATTPTYTINTVDGTASITPVAPTNVVIYGETDFKWNYSNTKGTAQYAYDIQLSNDNGETWETIFDHVISSEHNSEVYSGITSGTKLWRARGYNQQDVSGDWSDSLSFICNVPPEAPTITSISGTGRKTASWEATDQVAFHLLVEDSTTGETVYDSGDVYTSATQYLINEYLSNGDYTVKVKIINIYGKESAYASVQFTQSAETLHPTMALSYNSESGEVLVTVTDPDATEFYLKRNGVLIAHFTGSTYSDRFASGSTTYEAISVDQYGAFGTVTESIKIEIDGAYIIRRNGQKINVSERWNNMFASEMTEERRYQANEFLGASVPSHTFAKMRTKRYTFAFNDEDKIASDLLGEIVFYADQFGNGDWVVPVGFTRTDYWYGDDTSMQLELTEFDEGISYAV